MKYILLVEDEQLFADILSMLFEDKYNLQHVLKAEDAIPYFNKADIIISDIDQPNSAGGIWLETYSRKTRPALPFILMSGREPNDPLLANIDQRTAFFSKPFNLGDLEIKVKELLQ